jgi:hypothetical protein
VAALTYWDADTISQLSITDTLWRAVDFESCVCVCVPVCVSVWCLKFVCLSAAKALEINQFYFRMIAFTLPVGTSEVLGKLHIFLSLVT